jgi:phage-related baseplate assembly protein
MTLPHIAAALAAPKTHKVLTTYADGTVKEHLTASLAQANNWAIGESRKIGRDLIDRATGKTVHVTDVEVVELPSPQESSTARLPESPADRGGK